jgi:geranylgeranyl reductase family protein
VTLSASVSETALPRPVTVDVAIVGAGPAGTAAALALGGRGYRVAIIEKAVPPRYKTCGGGVLSRAVQLLPIDIAPAIERQCFEVEFFQHHPGLQFVVRREQPIISMVMRDRFDHLLTAAAQQAGTRLISGTSVRSVTPRENDVELATSGGLVNARFVIAADGAASDVARQAGAPPLRRVIAALECEVTLNSALLEQFSRAARFDFGLVPFGYGWVFPKEKHLSIGVLTTRRGAANLHDCYTRYLGLLGIQPLAEERHGYMIPPCHGRGNHVGDLERSTCRPGNHRGQIRRSGSEAGLSHGAVRSFAARTARGPLGRPVALRFAPASIDAPRSSRRANLSTAHQRGHGLRHV